LSVGCSYALTVLPSVGPVDFLKPRRDRLCVSDSALAWAFLDAASERRGSTLARCKERFRKVKASICPRLSYIPYGGARLFPQKSTCFTRSPLWPCMVHVWSRNARCFEPPKSSKSTVWLAQISGNQVPCSLLSGPATFKACHPHGLCVPSWML